MLARLVCLAALAAALLAAVTVNAPSSEAGVACASSYSYAGLSHGGVARAVRATITPLAPPRVYWGHVAAWIGVGGRGMGANRSDAWIQVGFSGFYGGVTKLYYEVARPGAAPRYTEVDAAPALRQPRELEVAEVAGHPSWWRILVDGKQVGEAVKLSGSHGRWQPTATAESWNAGKGRCNGFAYRFDAVTVATRTGWRKLTPGTVFQDPGYRLRRGSAGFLAASR